MLRIITAIAGVLFFGAGAAYCETYTMETYYPSPAGVYQNMTVTSTTVLARDGGAVTVGSAANPARLAVNGNANIKGVVVPGNLPADPADQAQKVEGAIYFNTTSKKHRVFQNAAWQDLGGASLKTTADTPCNESNAGKEALGVAVLAGGAFGGEHASTGFIKSVKLKWMNCVRVLDPDDGNYYWTWK